MQARENLSLGFTYFRNESKSTSAFEWRIEFETRMVTTPSTTFACKRCAADAAAAAAPLIIIYGRDSMQ